MDCQMPGMDGYEATAKLRAVETRRTPVVAVTANAMPEDRARCLEAGMDDYLPKPVSRASLESVLTRWLPAP
jgi:CheY-like chemotaxis protein